MERFTLSQSQKESFEYAFERIMSDAPPKIQILWNGKIIWIRDIPTFNNAVHMKLYGKSANDYESLIGKLNKGIL